MDNPDVADKLDRLSERQCRILYWLCQGKSRAWIAGQLQWPVGTIKRDIGIIYEKLDLDHLGREERRFQLATAIRPIHLSRVKNPDTDCRPKTGPEPPPPETTVDQVGGQTDVIEPEPKPETDKIVDEDEHLGIIPVNGSLVPEPPTRQNQLTRILVGMLGVLLLVICYLLFTLLTRQPNVNPQPTAAVAFVTVIVTQPPPTPLPTYTVPPTQTPPPTQAAVVKVVTATPPPATLTSVPSPTPPSTILFKDDFNNGLDPAWQVLSGKPIVVNDKLTTDQFVWLVVGDATWANYVVEFDMVDAPCLNDPLNEVAVRFTDLEHMVALTWQPCTAHWSVFVDGNKNVVPRTDVNPGPGHYRIVAQDDRFTFYVGDNKLSSFIDKTYQRGKVGLRLRPGTVIDNFSIKTVEK